MLCSSNFDTMVGRSLSKHNFSSRKMHSITLCPSWLWAIILKIAVCVAIYHSTRKWPTKMNDTTSFQYVCIRLVFSEVSRLFDMATMYQTAGIQISCVRILNVRVDSALPIQGFIKRKHQCALWCSFLAFVWHACRPFDYPLRSFAWRLRNCFYTCYLRVMV